MSRRRSLTWAAEVPAPWIPGCYRDAADPAVVRHGMVYRGVALVKLWRGSPKGRRPACWQCVHLGTGHVILTFEVRDPIALATRIAEIGCWEWEGLDGWKNVDPELYDKMGALIRELPAKALRIIGGRENPDAAREVAYANA